MSSEHDEEATRVKRAGGDAPSGIDIPNMTLGRQLGRGGMAIVFEGSDLGFNPPRRVAVKIIDAALSSDEEFRARFDREASIVAGFRHPNIVNVYSSGETAGAKYMVMEYLPGGTLADRVRSGLLDSKEAIDVAADLADALAYSHSHDIVHRDFKPANVLFAADGKPVLSDFGVAKLQSSEQASMTRHASVIGAPRYMAPEQERAEEVTEAADVYSFGITLYEILTGSVPPLSLLARSGDTVPPGFAQRLSGQPPGVVNLIHRCLQANPDARPSAAECRDALRRIGRPASGTKRRPAPPSATFVGAAGALAGVVGLIVAFYWWTATRPTDAEPPRPPLVNVAITRSPPSARVFVGSAEISAPVIELPAGTYTLTAVAPGFHGTTQDLMAEGTAVTWRVALRPAKFTMQSFERFADLTEAQTITTGDVDSVEDETLRAALRLIGARQRGDGGTVDRETARLRTLEALGDDYAPVSLLLDSFAQQGALTTVMLTPTLIAAADRGGAVASYLVAIAHRGDLTSAGSLRTTSAAFSRYCGLMQAAADRGIDEANDFLERDGCTGR